MAILYFHEDYGGQMECCFLLNFKNQMGTVLTLQYEKCIIQNYFNNHFLSCNQTIWQPGTSELSTFLGSWNIFGFDFILKLMNWIYK